MVKFVNKLLDSIFGIKILKSRKYIYRRSYLYDLKGYFLKCPPQIIFDVGGYLGEETSSYSESFGNATIYVFEPFKDSYDKIVNRFRGNSKIIPNNFAITSEEGSKTFFINKDLSMNSLNRIDQHAIEAYSKNQHGYSVSVETTSVDIFCKKQRIQSIDFLKIDAEGEEYNILLGAKDMLSMHRIKSIYIEIMFQFHHEDRKPFFTLCEMLYAYGYELFNFYDLKNEENGQVRWGNALFHLSSKNQ